MKFNKMIPVLRDPVFEGNKLIWDNATSVSKHHEENKNHDVQLCDVKPYGQDKNDHACVKEENLQLIEDQVSDHKVLKKKMK